MVVTGGGCISGMDTGGIEAGSDMDTGKPVGVRKEEDCGTCVCDKEVGSGWEGRGKFWDDCWESVEQDAKGLGSTVLVMMWVTGDF